MEKASFPCKPGLRHHDLHLHLHLHLQRHSMTYIICFLCELEHSAAGNVPAL